MGEGARWTISVQLYHGSLVQLCMQLLATGTVLLVPGAVMLMGGSMLRLMFDIDSSTREFVIVWPLESCAVVGIWRIMRNVMGVRCTHTAINEYCTVRVTWYS